LAAAAQEKQKIGMKFTFVLQLQESENCINNASSSSNKSINSSNKILKQVSPK